MAIFIFIKNSSGLYRIAENQDILDQNKNFFTSEYDLVTVSEEYFNGIRLNKKELLNRVENTVTLGPEDFTSSFKTHLQMQEYINSIVSVMDNYLVTNSNKPMVGDILTYKNYIQTINPSTLITEADTSVTPPIPAIPFTSSIEKHAESQGIKAINILQLL